MAHAQATAAPRTKGLQGIEGKNVLVTGGSSGHRAGDRRALRRARRERRDQLPAHARGGRGHRGAGARLRRARSSSEGVRDVLVQGDVSNEDDVVRMVARGRRAASAASTSSSTTPASRSRGRPTSSPAPTSTSVLAVNLRGSFLCAREAIRHFLAEDKPGSIVNISSVHQLIPKPELPRLLASARAGCRT